MHYSSTSERRQSIFIGTVPSCSHKVDCTADTDRLKNKYILCARHSLSPGRLWIRCISLFWVIWHVSKWNLTSAMPTNEYFITFILLICMGNLHTWFLLLTTKMSAFAWPLSFSRQCFPDIYFCNFHWTQFVTSCSKASVKKQYFS